MKKVYAVLAVLVLSACGGSNSNSPATAQQKSYGNWKFTGNYCQDLGAGITCGLNSKPVDCAGYGPIESNIRFSGTGKTIYIASGPFPTQWPVLESKDGLTAAIPALFGVQRLTYGDTVITIQADHAGKCITEFVRE